jgi:hypothetical protein
MEQGQTALIAMIEKSLGKRKEGETPSKEGPEEESDGNKTPPGGSKKQTEGVSSNQLSGPALLEFRQSVKKVELPMFNGEDPAGWISRAEVYFRVQGTRPEVKVSLAQLCMEGPTIHFFNSLFSEEEEVTWEQLKEALLERYGGHGDGDVYELLTELKQSKSVDEYVTEFEYLTAQIPKLPDKQFLGYFLHGLKEEIRGRVRSLMVAGNLSRAKVIQVARAVEKELSKDGSMLGKSKMGYGSNRPNSFGPNKGGLSDWVLVKGGKEATPRGSGSGPRDERPNHGDRRNGPRDRGFTHLSYNELMDRKRKGLCFKCKQPFQPGHQCPEKHLRVLIVDDEVDGEEEGRMLAVEVGDEEVEGELSLMNFYQLGSGEHAKPQSIKLRGTIHEVPVLILIDSGATHNFISHQLVQKMNLTTEDTPPLNIKLGDGSCSKTTGTCKNLEIGIEGLSVVVDAQMFELGGMDVVLGIEWLRTLGDMIINWKK